MKKPLLRLLAIPVLAFLVSGCASYFELDMKPDLSMKGDNDEKIIATYSSIIGSYTFFGVIPFESGRPWLSGDCPEDGDGGMSFFKDYVTLDNSIKSLKSALVQAQSNRICNLVNEETTSFIWSLGLIHRHIIRTNCLILAPQPKTEKATDIP